MRWSFRTLSAVSKSTPFLASLVLLAILSSSPSVKASTSATAPGAFLGLTASELIAQLGEPTDARAKGPYGFEYVLTRQGMPLTYRFRLALEHEEPRVVECYISFDEPVPLAEVSVIVPESSILVEPGTALTLYELPLRSYARDVLLFAYPIDPGTNGAEEPIATVLLPAGFGLAASDITRETLIRGVVISRHSPYPEERAIDNPLTTASPEGHLAG